MDNNEQESNVLIIGIITVIMVLTALTIAAFIQSGIIYLVMKYLFCIAFGLSMVSFATVFRVIFIITLIVFVVLFVISFYKEKNIEDESRKCEDL